MQIQALCRRWGYTPEQALRAPSFVLRWTALLHYAEQRAADDGE